MQTAQQVTRAREDEPFLERFIEAYQPFILREASKSAGFAVTKSDDEYSVALLAFYEAVKQYDAQSGAFGAFAALVIRRRLTDYYRSVRRFDPEISLAPQTFDGAVDADAADSEVQLAVVERMSETRTETAEEEIERANVLFRPYGFSFYDLNRTSPRADKTRRACASAVAALLGSPILMDTMRQARALPVKTLTEHSRVPRRLIERHRSYIIAAALLLDGDFPILSEYLHTLRKEMAQCGQ